MGMPDVLQMLLPGVKIEEVLNDLKKFVALAQGMSDNIKIAREEIHAINTRLDVLNKQLSGGTQDGKGRGNQSAVIDGSIGSRPGEGGSGEPGNGSGGGGTGNGTPNRFNE
ncbi:MAG TPA: hypothetical protein VMW50_08450 [Dehalococcoidia bacterium]|nr:hypothetical protein [Dehalococcoidia bacterium]